MAKQTNDTQAGRFGLNAQFTAGSKSHAPVILRVDNGGTIQSCTSNFAQLHAENPVGKHWLSLFNGYSRQLLAAPEGFEQYLFVANEKVYRVLAGKSIEKDGQECALVTAEAQAPHDAMQLEQFSRMLCLGRMTAEFTHEMNNALANLAGWVQLFLEGKNSDDPDIESLRIIDKTVRHVSRTASSLMAMARGERAVYFRPLDLNELVESMMEVVEPRCRHNGITLSRQLQALPPVNGSVVQLKQVFLNLLINAINATSVNGNITVITVEDGDNRVRVEVKDTGCGITAERFAKIFEPFYTTQRETGGAGLGLYICKEIIRRHHGEIAVESKQGEGSTFSVILPTEPEGRTHEPDGEYETFRFEKSQY